MTQGKSDGRERRAERLAAALKENIRRRKAQARGRAADEDAMKPGVSAGEPAKPAKEPEKP